MAKVSYEKEKIMKGIQKLIIFYPEFRFGQIINMLQQDIRRDLYNTKDQQWLDAIEIHVHRAELRAKEREKEMYKG